MDSHMSPFEEWTPKKEVLLPLRKGHKQTCPKCGSFFIQNKACESCGYQLSFDRLGEPFGERSFYALKENYEEGQSWAVKNFSFISDRNTREFFVYKKSLKLRFDTLVQAFRWAGWQGKKNQSELFFLELSDLLQELDKVGIERSSLLKRFQNEFRNQESGLFFQKIEELIKLSPTKDLSKPYIKWPRIEPIWIKTFFLLGGMIFISLQLFSWLIS